MHRKNIIGVLIIGLSVNAGGDNQTAMLKAGAYVTQLHGGDDHRCREREQDATPEQGWRACRGRHLAGWA